MPHRPSHTEPPWLQSLTEKYSEYSDIARRFRAQSDASRVAPPAQLGSERAPSPVMRGAENILPTVPITEADVRRDRLRRNPAVQGAALGVRMLNVPADILASIPEVISDVRQGHPWRAALMGAAAALPIIPGSLIRRGGEYITGPALRIGEKVYEGSHGQAHIHVLMQIEEDLVNAARRRGVPERHVADDYYDALKRASSDDEGFVAVRYDANGKEVSRRFVNRKEAHTLAESNGQLIPGRKERLRKGEDDLHAGDLLPPPPPRARRTGIPEEPQDEATARAIFESVKEPDSGITLDPLTRKPTTQSGYSVADPAFTVPFSASDPRAQDLIRSWLAEPDVMARLQQPGAHIGAWHNPKTGELEVNISDMIPDETAARQLGIERKQHGIGHLIDGEYQGTIDLDPPASGALTPDPEPPPAPYDPLIPASQTDRAAQQAAYLEETGQTNLFNITMGRPRLDPERIGIEGAPNISALERGLPRRTPEGMLPEVPRGSVLHPEQVDIARPMPRDPRTWRRQREEFRDVVRSEDWLADIVRGIGMGGDRWYEADRIAQSAIDALGPVEGRKAFEEWARAMGPTSISTPPTMNVRNASWWFGQPRERVAEMAARGEAPPPGYGGLYPQQSTQNFNRGMSDMPTEGWNKLRSYTENILGNWRPYTLDRHEARRMRQIRGGGSDVMRSGRYSAAEAEMQDLAADLSDRGLLDVPAGRDPTAPMQAARWTGGAQHTGVRGWRHGLPSLQDIFSRAIFRTAVHTGLPPSEVAARFWKKQMPLLGVGGLLGAGAYEGMQERGPSDGLLAP